MFYASGVGYADNYRPCLQGCPCGRPDFHPETQRACEFPEVSDKFLGRGAKNYYEYARRVNKLRRRPGQCFAS